MLRAVKFNNEEFSAAQEIHHEWPEWRLPQEFVPVEMACPQLTPQAILRLGFIGTQPSRAVC